ncbi:NUDIX domain-containing protein [Carboxylicivirga sp. N1Y90]|uniref:NUDIX domain-containing protein n=1 Tax=Carboxylicivirga fragile TaxID=3417571 RepID=UPI003D327DBD|nr:NUDIX hydrolase [Marinilabiliaceae bacterium N1Y90]
MKYTYEYPRPALTTDVILICKGEETKVLLIKRANEPYKHCWAFPGGFVDMHEDLSTGALRELKEETGIEGITIHQFRTFGAVDRDPRHRTVSVVYYAFVDSELSAIAMDDAADVAWFNVDELPKLAFDHDEILKAFLKN